jgi:hypothetical protein
MIRSRSRVHGSGAEAGSMDQEQKQGPWIRSRSRIQGSEAAAGSGVEEISKSRGRIKISGE